VLIDLDGLQANQSVKAFTRQFKKDVLRFSISWEPEFKENIFFKKYMSVLLS
jgi:hypothetical protein